MPTWRFLSPTLIEHETGFKLEVESGSWHDPEGLNPTIPEAMPVREAALLLREGLLFAARNRKMRPSRKVVQPAKAPTENTLRLRRK